MRSSILLSASALLLVSASAKCTDNSLAEIVSAFDCGDAHTIAECLTQKTQPLEPCLVSLGCPFHQIKAGINWIKSDCALEIHPDLISLREAGNAEKPMELRKRASSTAAAAAATEAVTTTAAAATTAAAVATTSAAAAATTVATTAASTTAAATTASTSSGSTSTSGSSSSTGTGLVCMTSSYSSFSYCLTSTASTECITTSTGFPKCASGLICATSTADSSVSCMKIDNTLNTSGLVVTIVLSVVLAALLGSLFFMCYSANKLANAAKAKRESMFVTLGGKKDESEADLPLMSAAGPAGGTFGAGYTEVTGGNGVAGPRGEAPRLHPGLVETPDNEDDISYQSSARR